jgi:putative DNA primase/helicase
VSPEVKDLAEEKYNRLHKIIEDIHKFAKQSETRNRVAAGSHLATDDQNILISHTQLNKDPWLLNFENGTLDLRTGQLREHNRKDYITRLAPHKFDPNAACPVFDKFLLECMQGNRGLVDFIWRLLGYTAVGVTTEQILILNIGEGANGKTTFMNTVLDAFGLGYGGYAFAANSENLLTNKGGNKHETWRMDMFGKRLVTAMEVEEGRQLAESLIKELTGSDPITGRRMREDNWTYVPEHQLWVSANQLPHVRGTDEGIWRRLKVIPWKVSFRGREDQKLPQRLLQEIPGIWARIAREAVLWRDKGLLSSDAVNEATDDYRREQDPLQPMLDQWFLLGDELFVPRDVAWAAYLEYAEDSRNQVFHQRKRFYEAMRKRFPDHKDGAGTRGFKGLRLKTPQERHESSPRARLLAAQQSTPDDSNNSKLN